MGKDHKQLVMGNFTLITAYLLLIKCQIGWASLEVESPCDIPILRKSFEKLLHILNSGNEAFDVIFFNLPVDKCTLSFQKSRSMFFRDYPFKIDYQRFPVKYHQHNHLVIANLSAIWFAEYFFMHHTTLVVFPFMEVTGDVPVVNTDDTFSSGMRNLPAIVLALYVGNATNRLQVFYSFVCNGYCIKSESGGETNSELYHSLQNPKLLHRMLYRNGNQRNIQVKVSAQRANNLLDTCSEKSRTPSKYADCKKQFMVLAEIMKVHNFSLNTDMWKYIGEGFLDTSLTKQFIRLDSAYFSYTNFAYRDLVGFSFSQNTALEVVYCLVDSKTDVNSSIDYSSWITPFGLETWMLSILLLSGLTAIYKSVSSFGNVVLNFINKDKGQSKSESRKPFHKAKLISLISIDVLLMFVSTFYGNEILSILAVPVPPKLYETLAEMLEFGYNILWESFLKQPWIRFYEDFKQRGMLSTLNSSFHIYNYSTDSEIATSYLSGKFLKLVPMEYTSNVPIYEKELREQENYKDAKCYRLPEVIDVRSWYLDVYTVNMVWMLETYSRIVRSGLVGKWAEWEEISSRYFNKLHEQTNFSVAGKTAGEIQLDGILAIIIAAACVYAFCMLCLLVEVLLHKHVINRNTIQHLELTASPKKRSDNSLSNSLDENNCIPTTNEKPVDSNHVENCNPGSMLENLSSDSLSERICCSPTDSKPKESALVLQNLEDSDIQVETGDDCSEDETSC